MLSAIVTSNHLAAQSIQKGFSSANLKTLVYKTDFSITDHYDFLYHDGFFIHLNNPKEQHLNFCLHLQNLISGRSIFILAENCDSQILNELKSNFKCHIFLSPFAFRKIVALYRVFNSFELDSVVTCESSGLSLKLDSPRRTLIVNENITIPLVNKEFFILQFLFAHQQKIVSKIDLFEFVWGKNLLGSIETVDVHMSRLRRKMRSYLKCDPIRTVHCAGYVLE